MSKIKNENKYEQQYFAKQQKDFLQEDQDMEFVNIEDFNEETHFKDQNKFCGLQENNEDSNQIIDYTEKEWQEISKTLQEMQKTFDPAYIDYMKDAKLLKKLTKTMNYKMNNLKSLNDMLQFVKQQPEKKQDEIMAKQNLVLRQLEKTFTACFYGNSEKHAMGCFKEESERLSQLDKKSRIKASQYGTDPYLKCKKICENQFEICYDSIAVSGVDLFCQGILNDAKIVADNMKGYQHI